MCKLLAALDEKNKMIQALYVNQSSRVYGIQPYGLMFNAHIDIVLFYFDNMCEHMTHFPQK